jgi:hypothetical protein
MFITMLSLKDNTFNKTNESNSDGFHGSISMEKKRKKDSKSCLRSIPNHYQRKGEHR